MRRFVPFLGSFTVVLLSVSVLIPTTAATVKTTASVSTNQDTFATVLAPTTTRGTWSMIRANGQPNKVIYLRFAVPSSAQPIQSATVVLNALTTSADGVQAHLVANDSWSAATLTRDNAPPVNPNVVGQSGPISAGAVTRVLLTTAVAPGQDLDLALTTVTAANVDFSSSRTSGGPRLDLQYVTPPTATSSAIPTASASPSGTATAIPTSSPTARPTATPTARPTPTATVTPTPNPTSANPVFGVYTEDPAGPDGWANNADAFNAWLGSQTTAAVQVYGSYNDARWLVPPVATWVRAKSGRVAEFSVDMLVSPTGGSLQPPSAGASAAAADSALMKKGANGDFNSGWASFAQGLVGNGVGDSIIRPGWECDGNWFAWSAVNNEANYAEYFRQLVGAMRSVPGQNFKFDWNCGDTSSFRDGQSKMSAYPGDAYVNYLGVDPYDENWSVYPSTGPITAAMEQSAWTANVGSATTGGLDWLVSQARQHSKDVVFGEWDIWSEGAQHGGGDDAYYVNQMHAFIHDNSNRVAATFVFDANMGADANSQLSGGAFPLAAAAFKATFGKDPSGKLLT